MTEVAARLRAGENGWVHVLSPSVGLVRELPLEGDVVSAGRPIGRLETLGALSTLIAPQGASGRVVRTSSGAAATVGVGYGSELLTIDTRIGAASGEATEVTAATRTGSLVFAAPMSGRFYSRAAPTKPAMASLGQVIELGQALCLLEVMKTFNRVTYGGVGAVERARITRIVPSDGDDVARGAVLFELEPV